MTLTEFENATLEAIYWWNRTEGYYYKYFSRLNELHNRKDLFQFFTTKIFEVFLREYSIRRNIASGYQNVDIFIEKVIKNDFISRVKNGEINVIDDTSEKIRIKGNTTNNRQTRSLLSKIAFLINPNEFSLFDNLAKASLWELIKNQKTRRQHELEFYSSFIVQTDKLITLNSGILKNHESLLNEFNETAAYEFFHSNPKAFERRIFDKYLWLRKMNQNSDGRKINNHPYKEFVKF